MAKEKQKNKRKIRKRREKRNKIQKKSKKKNKNKQNDKGNICLKHERDDKLLNNILFFFWRGEGIARCNDGHSLST